MTTPTSQPTSELQKAIEQAQNALHCLYIAVEQNVADDINSRLTPVIIAALRTEQAEQRVKELETELSKATIQSQLCLESIHMLEQKLQQCEKEREHAGGVLDHLLSHCKDSECEICAKIICPHKDEMHYHHDGCPSCVGFDQMKDKLDQLTTVAQQLAEALNAKGRLHVLHDDVSFIASMPLHEWVEYKEKLNKALTLAKQAGLLKEGQG